jgi:putative membrane protein
MFLAQMTRRFDGPVIERANDHDNWIHAVLTLLIVLIIAGVAIYLIRAFAQTSGNTATEVRDPLDIARERYAKGEITKEELADIKKELKS